LSLAKDTCGAVPYSVCFLAAIACAELIRPLTAINDEAMAIVKSEIYYILLFALMVFLL
jgi:hypothetical protein